MKSPNRVLEMSAVELEGRRRAFRSASPLGEGERIEERRFVFLN
jgi:hypothetical protein